MDILSCNCISPEDKLYEFDKIRFCYRPQITFFYSPVKIYFLRRNYG